MNDKVFKNASWIVACKLVKAILTIFITMFTARYLGPSNYGTINYAASLVVFFVPLVKLGFDSTMVHNFVDSPENEGEILGTSVFLNFISSLLSIIGMYIFVSIVNAGEKVTIIVCFLYSIQLVFQALEMIIYWFQYKLLNRYSSIAMLFSYLIVAIFQIYLLVSNSSIYWFAISNSIDFSIICIFLYIIYLKHGTQKITINFKIIPMLLNKSKYYIISSFMVTIFSQSDRIILKLFDGDESVGIYAAAVNCANMASFVYAAIIDSFKTPIFESKKNNLSLYKNNIVNLYSLVLYMSIIMCIIMTIFSKLIIQILYGQDYLKASSILKIIVWYTIFSYIGSIRDVILLAEEKQKYLLLINALGALFNITLNSILVPKFTIVGAAISALLTQIFTNFILNFIFKQLRFNNMLILNALNPKNIIKIFKKIFHIKNNN